ncbi:MAG: DUF2071 domain-containing protein [Bacteroidota bacterium]
MSFLTAEWRKLAIANYEIDPAILTPYVPKGTELDFWQDRCYVSLIGFRFLNTKVLGLKIPFHVNFEEVNLRFYVRRQHGEEWRRGVVFIKEIVPKYAITFVANTLYQEHYETRPMRSNWMIGEEHQQISYEWKRGQNWQRIMVEASKQGHDLTAGSEAEFITEHYWGYAAPNPRKTNEYEVTHPKWQVYPVHSHDIELDFAANYGPSFAFLQDQTPVSVMLAEGSPITVEGKTTLRV